MENNLSGENSLWRKIYESKWLRLAVIVPFLYIIKPIFAGAFTLVLVSFFFAELYSKYKKLYASRNKEIINHVESDTTREIEQTSSVIIKKNKYTVLYVVLICWGFFFIFAFVGLYAFFTNDPAGRAPIIAGQQCGGAEYVARKWCVPNWMQACGPTYVVIHKVNKSLVEELFGDEFILLSKSVSDLESREHLFDSHWVNSGLQPKILWDDMEGTSTNNFYFRSKARQLTSREVSCLQEVIPILKDKVHASSDSKIKSSFRGDVGVVWEMEDSFFGFMAFVPSSGRKAVYDLSKESTRVKATGSVIESFSFNERSALLMRVPYYSDPNERYSFNSTYFTFKINLDKKSIAIPDYMSYTQQLREVLSNGSTTFLTKETSIVYEDIINAMNEAKFDNGKTVGDILVIERIPGINFASTTIKSIKVEPAFIGLETAPDSGIVPTSQAQVNATTTTYTNTSQGYIIQHPQDWILVQEKSVMDRANKIRSIVTLYNQKETEVITIIVNENESLIKLEAPKKETITIDGQVETAYIYPKGYEGCNPRTEDCSFFVIPISKNGIWYELHVRGNATSITDTYKSILSTFKFTK